MFPSLHSNFKFLPSEARGYGLTDNTPLTSLSGASEGNSSRGHATPMTKVCLNCPSACSQYALDWKEKHWGTGPLCATSQPWGHVAKGASHLTCAALGSLSWKTARPHCLSAAVPNSPGEGLDPLWSCTNTTNRQLSKLVVAKLCLTTPSRRLNFHPLFLGLVGCYRSLALHLTPRWCFSTPSMEALPAKGHEDFIPTNPRPLPDASITDFHKQRSQQTTGGPQVAVKCSGTWQLLGKESSPGCL